MVHNINEILKNKIKELDGNKITIIQEGFIENKFFIESAKCNIKFDVLKIENKECYIKINLNQVCNIEYLQNEIKLDLDNDTKIKIIFL